MIQERAELFRSCQDLSISAEEEKEVLDKVSASAASLRMRAATLRTSRAYAEIAAQGIFALQLEEGEEGFVRYGVNCRVWHFPLHRISCERQRGQSSREKGVHGLCLAAQCAPAA